MKYLNQLNILLAGLSVLVVAYAMSRTLWGPETEPQLNIPRQSSESESSPRGTGSLSPATERRNVGGRRIVAPATSPRDPIQAPVQAAAPGSPGKESNPTDSQGAVAPAPSGNAPATVPPGAKPTSVISISAAPTNTGREAEHSPAEQPRSRAVGKNRPARQPRPFPRLPAGRSGFPGGAKRDRQDGPPSPPVRSSAPAGRLP